MVQEVSGRASANAAEPALVADATGAASVSALPGDGQAREWVAGSYVAQTSQGPYDIAGWIRPPFALDFRVFDDDMDWISPGWHLTHIPSGYGVCGIIGNICFAKDLADQILAVADWSFADPDGAKSVGGAFTEFRKLHPGKIIGATCIAGPLTGLLQS